MARLAGQAESRAPTALQSAQVRTAAARYGAKEAAARAAAQNYYVERLVLRLVETVTRSGLPVEVTGGAVDLSCQLFQGELSWDNAVRAIFDAYDPRTAQVLINGVKNLYDDLSVYAADGEFGRAAVAITCYAVGLSLTAS